MQEFHQANGINALQDIIIDYKTKYSILYNNNTGSQYFNSMNSMQSFAGSNSNGPTSFGGTYNSNEFKDKDTQLSKEIRLECIKILKTFVNTSVSSKFE